MNEFIKAENDGRMLFKSILDQCKITDQNPSVDLYDTVDYYYSINGQKCGAEIKKRAEQYQDYDTHLMEIPKLKALCKRLKDNELDNVYYVCFFGNDVAYIYSVKKIVGSLKDGLIKVRNMNLNRTTAIYTGTKKKQIIMIPKNLAQKLTRINGKWIKN